MHIQRYLHPVLAKGYLLIPICCVAAALAGCADYYAPGRAYAGPVPAPYYGGPGYYGGGSVAIDIQDRPYYTRGAGYYVGPRYYVWRPGHWVVRNGQRYWVHGHYVLR
jgi:hypothetical protein